MTLNHKDTSSSSSSLSSPRTPRRGFLPLSDVILNDDFLSSVQPPRCAGGSPDGRYGSGSIHPDTSCNEAESLARVHAILDAALEIAQRGTESSNNNSRTSSRSSSPRNGHGDDQSSFPSWPTN
mmetsp:Transcript_24877/g.40693  ORF Transcript_24877/g.40693 Transcript_24877/m.40693 type:complete len:124 (-) Transcript_24877:227-598(-)|eukprot:CAMPEP_0178837572 /NCGR_PEP_ID=MMETSP0746-20121128/12836_1 /TAXON_ID=913974 /ORGANISM="Nitzschia punctata, Strain CCMP561" /LENGTH=123 /DNA_ID=CAMNT_0020500431 /DNA_START=114 /DNA_END=485 /DNA_ORIENTATION=+